MSRKKFDDDDLDDRAVLHHLLHQLNPGAADGADRLSTYPGADHGPEPVPEWVVTDPNAADTDLGALKSGKEADVTVVRRTGPDGRSCLLAAKRYRDADHRMFHRDAGYLEGRRVRRSREMRAMATRTSFGRELIAGQWAFYEFAALSQLWSAGLPVPYPVSFDGEELLMEFVGDDDGVAAPRLAALRVDDDGVLHDLLTEAVGALEALAAEGYAHGDLSPYNVLVHHGRLVLIDLPQLVDVVGNPQGPTYLARDARNLLGWFVARGAEVDVDAVIARLEALVAG